ncbi:MAG: lipid-A-disaccharide synthase [Bryobacterales bacterium]
MRVLVSAGETSGDRYAAELVAELRRRFPNAEFFGCAGPRLRAENVEPIVRSEDLAVVGLFEVVRHIPRIYREYQSLLAEAERRRPDLAILCDAPDFNLRVAAKLKPKGIPVVDYVAPQMWAWRPWRVRKLRRIVDLLLCIFPFEEEWFNERGVPTRYVGHPLASELGASASREEFLERHGFDPTLPLLSVLPGSRQGEAARHLPALLDAIERLTATRRLNVVLAASNTTGKAFFQERISGSPVTIVENDTSNALAHADAAMVASGTATVEAALLGAPMVVFYEVSKATWLLGKPLVRVPFYSMVNLLAQRRIVPELIQHECRGERLAEEVKKLLDDPEANRRMRRELEDVRKALAGDQPAAVRAAEAICERFDLTK